MGTPNVTTTTSRADGPTVAVAELLGQVASRHEGEMVDAHTAAQVAQLLDGVLEQRHAVSAWAELIGPVLAPTAVSALLGLSATAVDKRRRSGKLLAFKVESGRWFHPLGQFVAADGAVRTVSGLDGVLAALDAPDGLAAVRWACTPNRRLAGSTPLDALRGADGVACVDGASGRASSASAPPSPGVDEIIAAAAAHRRAARGRG